MSPREPNPLEDPFINDDDSALSDESSCYSCDSCQQQQHQQQTTTRQFVKRRVSFGVLSVREYERIVGDHPETKRGPPLAIGNLYVESGDIVIPSECKQPKRPSSFRLNSAARRRLLIDEWGWTHDDVQQAEKTCQRHRRTKQQQPELPFPLSLLSLFSRDKLLNNFSSGQQKVSTLRPPLTTNLPTAKAA